MRKFRFHLQTVLDLRKRAEDEALRAVGLAQQQLVAENARRERCLADLTESHRQLEALGGTVASGRDYQTQQVFIEGTHHRIRLAEHAILRASRSVEKAMHAFLIAKRRTRAIEVLRERAQAEHKRQVARKEFKEQDDINVMRSRILPEHLA